MRIVILGAGTVGASIADVLCSLGHDVTVVDHDAEHIRRINEDLDVLVVNGSASQSSVLFQTGISSADICLAVTGQDEVNIVAASMAKAMGARRALARAYAPVFRDLSTFDYQLHFDVDRLLSLEQLTAMALARGCRHPGTVVVDQLARGEIEIQEVSISSKCKSREVPLHSLGLPSSVRIGAIYRDGRVWIAGAEDQLEAGDRISLIGRPEDVEATKSRFHVDVGPRQRVAIAGGGETGYHLAKTLEKENFSVVLMEQDPNRCEELANSLDDTTVIHADATRRAVLEEERIGKFDVFVSCTGDDENNILAGVEARELGAQKILAVVGRPDYANIVGKLGIDLAVSEREVITQKILSFLNTGVIISRLSLPGGDILVYELEVKEGVEATKSTVAELPLPKRCLIAAVSRQEFVRVPTATDQLQAGDMVVIFVEQTVADHALALFQT